MKKLIRVTSSLSVAALVSVFVLAAGGCSKDQDSLLVLALEADPPEAGVSSVVIVAGPTTKTFLVSAGLSGTAVSLGVYVPASVTGSIDVTATGTGHGTCYRGTKSVTIPSAGSKVDVALTLTPSDTCGTDGGAAGSGAAGTGGGGVSGTTGAGGGSGTTGGGGSMAGTAGPDGGAAGTSAAAGRDGGAAGMGAAGTGAAGTGAAGTTPPQLAWSVGENIEKDVVKGSYWPRVAMDAHGHVLVGWTEGDYPAVKLYNPTAKSWGATKVLDQRGSVQDVYVAMDDLGHSVAAWVQVASNSPPAELVGVWSSHSEDGGTTWSAPARIHNGPAWGGVVLAMSATGAARAAWEETDGQINSLWSAAYDPATKAFAAAAQVKVGSDVYDRYANIAVAPSGQGLLVWVQRDTAGRDSVWGSTFATPGGVLSTPALLETDIVKDVDLPTAAISADGTHGIVVWDQLDAASNGELWANEWTMAGGFAGAKKVFAADGVAAPVATVDKNYTVTVAWGQPFTGYKWNVVTARKVTGQAWGAPVPLETTNQGAGCTNEYSYPAIGSDAAGNVHVLWRREVKHTATTTCPQFDEIPGTFSVVVRTFSGNVWQPEVTLGMKAGLLPYIYPQLAVGSDGHAAAVFTYSDPTSVGDADAYNLFVGLYK